MKRFHHLIIQDVEERGFRPVSRDLGINPTSVHDYCNLNTEPRLPQMELVARHYNVTLPGLVLEHTDHSDITEELFSHILKLTPAGQKKLLAQLKKTG